MLRRANFVTARSLVLRSVLIQCMPSCQVSVEGVSPDQYLERFAWNEAKYPPRRPLSETVSTITETTQKLEDDLKACMPIYTLHARDTVSACSMWNPSPNVMVWYQRCR